MVLTCGESLFRDSCLKHVCVCVGVLVVAGGRWGIESPESGLGYKDKWLEFYSVNNGAALESF